MYATICVLRFARKQPGESFFAVTEDNAANLIIFVAKKNIDSDEKETDIHFCDHHIRSSVFRM